MRYSKLFGKTIKKVAGEVTAKSHELLVRGGFIHQEMAGSFTWLPLGKRVLDKVDKIIKEEMNKIGGQEIFMPLLHPKENWLKTGRWDSFDVLFKVKSQTGKEYALAPTHEEIVTPLVADYLKSYRELPLFLYHISTKFRDEPRAKSGVIRGREFGMKDLYSFHASHQDFQNFYEKAKIAYLKVFKRCGLDAKITEASGGSFTKKISHEFMIVSEAGEDSIIYCPVCSFCQNKDIAVVKVGDKCPKCGKTLAGAKAIEVGNIFDLGTKFSEDFGFYYTARDGSRQSVVMGCYGIGDTRLVGAIVEAHHDERGIVWPESVAPYSVHLISISDKKPGNTKIQKRGKTQNEAGTEAEKIYQKLMESGVEVLYDDREEVSVGEKLADCDLIGIPLRMVVSKKTLSQGMVEVKKRDSEKITLISIKSFMTKQAFLKLLTIASI